MSSGEQMAAMTPQEERKFRKIYAMLDSPHQGERQAALEVIRQRSEQFGWPSFGDTMRSLGETVPLARHQELERDFAELSGKLSVFGKFAALLAVVIAFGYGVYQALPLVGATSAARSNATPAAPTPALARAGVSVMDQWQKWIADNTTKTGNYVPEIVHFFVGTDYREIVGRDSYETTDSNCYGKLITRHCVRYYVANLDYTMSPRSIPSPGPYALDSLSWSKAAPSCQLPPLPMPKGNAMANLISACLLVVDYIPTMPFCL